MASNNPLRPSYRPATRDAYALFYERIESSFEPEDMTPQRLAEWLNSDQHPLIDQLALVKLFDNQIKEARTIEELRIIRAEISKLPLHRNKLSKRIEFKRDEILVREREDKIAIGISQTREFARERGIELSEKTKGGIYNNWGRYRKKAVVIFKNGKIKTWRYVK